MREVEVVICGVEAVDLESIPGNQPSGRRAARLGTDLLTFILRPDLFDTLLTPNSTDEQRAEGELLEAARHFRQACLGSAPQEAMKRLSDFLPHRSLWARDPLPPEPAEAQRKLAQVMNNLGALYLIVERRQDALDALQIAEELFREAIPHEKGPLAGVLKNLAAVHFREGDDPLIERVREHHLKRASEYLQEAQALLRS